MEAGTCRNQQPPNYMILPVPCFMRQTLPFALIVQKASERNGNERPDLLGKLALIHGNTENKIHAKTLGNRFDALYCCCDVFVFEVGNDKEAVKIHLLQIVVLRNDAENKTDELIRVMYAEIRNRNKADLVVQFVHVAGVFIEINNIAENIPHLGIDLIQ